LRAAVALTQLLRKLAPRPAVHAIIPIARLGHGASSTTVVK
jgi:hypothetical protein